MVTQLPAWLSKCADALRRLADQPFTLFLLLLAVNALSRPYQNCAHDARLYSLQVINQAENGAFADDVFLRYGSQDQYSIFSRAVGPLAAAFGVRPVFFFLYLIFNTYFIWALFQLIRRLFADPVVATASLIFLVSADLYYGGHGIFSAHEQFFTPRLVATAMVLHALDRLVAQRFLSAALILAFAMVVHPLMAFGGVLIWIGYLAWIFLGPKIFAFTLGSVCVLLAIVLALPSTALLLFGQIDDDWHEMIRLAVLYNYPDAWSYIDWINHGLAFALGIAAFVWLFRSDPVRAPFFFIVTLLAVIGLVLTTIASLSPYALLFQGQPYRVVWILKIMQIPLGFMVLARLCESPAFLPRLVTVALAAFFIVFSYANNEFILILFAIPIAVFIWRFLESPARSDWWRWAGITAFLLGCVGWMLYRWGFIIVERGTILTYWDRADFVRLLMQCIPPVLWLAAAVILVKKYDVVQQARRFRFGCLFLTLAIPSVYFGMDVSSHSRHLLTRYGADVDFAHAVIEQRSQNRHRAPTVYSSLGRAEYVWLDLRANNYFDVVQTAGVMFNRQTALELRRRIDIVSPFEMERVRMEALFLTEDGKASVEKYYQQRFDGPPPTEADLARLCAEPGLDFVVIPQEFPGLYSAGNGRIFVYECNKVRNTSSFSARVEAPAAMPFALQTGR